MPAAPRPRFHANLLRGMAHRAGFHSCRRKCTKRDRFTSPSRSRGGWYSRGTSRVSDSGRNRSDREVWATGIVRNRYEASWRSGAKGARCYGHDGSAVAYWAGFVREIVKRIRHRPAPDFFRVGQVVTELHLPSTSSHKAVIPI